MVKKVTKIYNNFEEYFLVVCIATLVLLIFAQVVMRFIFNNSLSWSEELARIIFIWASWIGISFGEKRGEHIKITIVTDRLKGNLKHVMFIIADLCTLAIVAVLVIKGYEVVEAVSATGAVTPSLHLPKSIPYWAVPISCAFMGIRLVQDIVFNLTSIRKEGVQCR